MNISELSLPLQEALEKQGIRSLSAVQEECIPPALAGKDIYAVAPTGTGKTAAFLIPLIERLIPQGSGKHKPQALILSPTRELASQTAMVCRSLLSTREGIRTALLCGGTDMNAQVRSFRGGADIVVATPARILDHLRRHTLKKDILKTIVLDEADEMLSMGFAEDVRKVCDEIIPSQIMMFSATENEDTLMLAGQLLKDPVIVRTGDDEVLPHMITHFHAVLSPAQKNEALEKILGMFRTDQVLLFCATRERCDALTSLLQKKGYSADTIHSEMDPARRRRIMNGFRQGKTGILIATDIAARGIDHAGIDTVIQYDCADTEEILVHRLGRTGRNNTVGTVITLLTPREKEKLKWIEAYMHIPSSPLSLHLSAPKEKRKSPKKQTAGHRNRRSGK